MKPDPLPWGGGPVVAEDSATVPVGGETCAVNAPRSQCPSATAELAALHWTYLNTDYHPDVLSSWSSGGCRAEIERRLGYRFTLERAALPTSATPGGPLPVSLTLRNDGYAAPANSRPVRLVLPFAAGGVTDVIWRLAAEKLGEKLGQRFVVENQPGPAGIPAI